MDNGDRRRSVRRFEDVRFLTGRGRYVEDFVLAGEAHAYVLRSPHAHALIKRIDKAAAARQPGVHGVFTSADLAGARTPRPSRLPPAVADLYRPVSLIMEAGLTPPAGGPR